jgi:uncharacterized protein YbjQ (UPF0145 family)/DNA-directed RNA polymerase subunit RPC12/RpoP
MINREDLLSGTRPEVGNRVLVTEKESFEGYQVMDYKGVVWGISMRAKDIVQDSLMGCKNVTGGELTSYTELSDEVRQRAWDRMVTSAKRIGANAVINFRFEITPVIYGAGGTAEVIAYGNAVVIEPIKNYVPLGGLGNILAEFVDNCSGSTVTKPQKLAETSPVASIVQNGDYTYVVCPECKLKYKVVKDENGKIRVAGIEDVDTKQEGLQIFCSRCGHKFTVPEQ